MLMKTRSKSVSHCILESLYYRTTLSFENQRRYENQRRGFEGEQYFDHFMNHAKQRGLVISDLFLSSQETNYQMDAVLILRNLVVIYEVKNFSGEYTYNKGMLFSKSGHSIQSPVGQVERKKSYLHNWLLRNNYPHSIESYVVFINPDFYIYNLPSTDSMLFVGQLERHFNELAQRTSTILAQDKKLAQTLVQHHNENYRPDNLPSYEFQDLRKGVLCKNCFSFECENTRQTRICKVCGYKEKIADAIYRTVLEFQLLFPKIPVTVQTVFDWCGGVYSKYRIKYILQANMTCHNKGPKSYYS